MICFSIIAIFPIEKYNISWFRRITTIFPKSTSFEPSNAFTFTTCKFGYYSRFYISTLVCTPRNKASTPFNS